jgi:hypothetical protein
MKNDRMKNDRIKSDRMKNDRIKSDRIKSITDPSEKFVPNYILILHRLAKFKGV